MADEFDDRPGTPPRWVVPGVLGALAVLLATGFGALQALRPSPQRPAAEVEADPLLRLGREVYLDRCVSCHGTYGRGDGPIAATLKGASPGNFTASTWRHGATPEAIAAVIDRGVPGTNMPGFATIIDDDRRRAVAAYVLRLGGRPVPDALRGP